MPVEELLVIDCEMKLKFYDLLFRYRCNRKEHKVFKILIFFDGFSQLLKMKYKPQFLRFQASNGLSALHIRTYFSHHESQTAALHLLLTNNGLANMAFRLVVLKYIPRSRGSSYFFISFHSNCQKCSRTKTPQYAGF